MIKYRSEIDGLRAVAVLAVLISHAEFFFGGRQILQGGFFGVDVFFVISGFLITSLIITELKQSETFSFVGFYERRARRLIPVLLLVFLVSFPFAWALLLPESFVDFSKSTIWSNAFLSNFYWVESLQIYGAESSDLKPFLHTWSLAIEEQFYIIYPIVLVMVYKWLRSYLLTVLTIMFFLSLWYAETLSTTDSLLSFYLLPSRFWELLAGGMLVFFSQIFPRIENQSTLFKALPFIGLCLLVYSFVFLEFDYITHPGFVTLFPVLGTMLIIGFPVPSSIVIKVLSHQLFVRLGLLSYSLYLWHFPLFAFLRVYGLFDSVLFKIAAICIALLLSLVSYKLIEQPFRSNKKTPRIYFYSLTLMGVFLVITLNYFVIKNDGYPERFNQSIALGVKEMKAYRQKYWENKSAYVAVENFTESGVSVVIIGNSWAKDVANALVEKSDYEVNFNGMTGHRCKAITLNGLRPNDKHYQDSQKSCVESNALRFKTKLTNTDLVILADNKWMMKVQNKPITDEVLSNIKQLRNYGYQGPVLIIANRPTYEKNVFEIVKEYGAVGDGVNHLAQNYLVESKADLKQQDLNAKAFYISNGVYYYSLVNSLCPLDSECKIVNNKMPLYYDKDHLTGSGARFVATDLVNYINNNIINQNKK